MAAESVLLRKGLRRAGRAAILSESGSRFGQSFNQQIAVRWFERFEAHTLKR